MKMLLFIFLLTFSCHITAQEVTTRSVRLTDFISFVADRLPADKPVQLILLLETPAGSWGMETQFYISQGLQLLNNRMKDEDKISLVLFGGHNQLVVDFTSNLDHSKIIKQLIGIINKPSLTALEDGMELAYVMAENNDKEDFKSTVILIRDDTTMTVNKRGKIAAANKPKASTAKHSSLGGTIAVTALGILPEVLAIIKD